jgi:DNA-binding transcriptional LysR family regulator
MNVDNLSLDQLRVFMAVTEEGSFSGAARRFGRAQSAVSYAVAMLEQQLGVALFDRSGYRPALTPAGQALVGEIAEIVARADRLKSQARTMAQGLEPEVALAVDVMFPIEEIGRLLKEFHEVFPTVSVRVFVETLGGVAELVLDHTCHLGILATLPGIPPALSAHAMPGILTLPVAAPDHPLAGMPAPIPDLALRDQVQIVLTDRSELTKGLDFGVLSHKTWRVSDLSAKLRLLREGLGWGGARPRGAVARSTGAPSARARAGRSERAAGRRRVHRARPAARTGRDRRRARLAEPARCRGRSPHRRRRPCRARGWRRRRTGAATRRAGGPGARPRWRAMGSCAAACVRRGS